MSGVPVVRDVETHKERAETHRLTGENLQALGDEWFAVCYFYSAYHLVKAAMNVDPIFDSATALSKIHPSLTMESRYAEHHSGGFGQNGRSLGVNEIVFKLYPKIRVAYNRLHVASCHVRYSRGLVTISTQSVIDDYKVVAKAFAAGEIAAANP